MPDRTNVNDALFPDDNIYNDDYKRDVNAADEDIRGTKLDLFGTDAVIYEGLAVSNGTNPDTFQVSAGRAADLDGYRVVVPLAVDNIPCVDATGANNYIAIRHVWSYSAARLPAKAGAVTYNSIRSDNYEINVALVQQTEAAGWILLGYAYKLAGIWHYVFDYPNRSLSAAITPWEMDFSLPGGLGVANMYHNGLNVDINSVGFGLNLTSHILNINNAAAGMYTVVLTQNGAVIGTTNFTIVAPGPYYSGVISMGQEVSIAQSDRLLAAFSAAPGGTDASYKIIGYVVGKVGGVGI